jgi:phospholipase D-like protein
MAEFLTTHGTAFQLENIIAGARKRLVLLSPYLQLSKTLFERLCDADHRGVRITLVYGKSSLAEPDIRALSALGGLSMFFLENLHAKCYFNEAQMVITSMNLYEFSEKTNREMGVLVRSEEPVYRAALAEVESIVAAAEPQLRQASDAMRRRTASPAGGRAWIKPRTTHGTRVGDAFCIRCRRTVEYDPERPYCGGCYQVWAQFENPRYSERVCHSCGAEASTSMDKPLCYGCYREEEGL